MNLPENIEKEIGGEKFEIIPYITFTDSLEIIGGCVNVFDEGAENVEGEIIKDNIGNWDKNISLMERNFNALLVEKCTTIKDYDYDILMANGVFELLQYEIVNAIEVYERIYKIIEKRDSLPYLAEKSVNKLIEKLPTAKELGGLITKVKKELMSDKFVSVLGKAKDIFDINTKVGN